MLRIVVAATVLAACGVDPSDDERPRTLEYVTRAVLAPSCANAQCHSSFRQEANRAYDTIERSCETMLERGDVVVDDPEASLLLIVLERTVDRMPYDQPLPDPEIALIRNWIVDGAPGLPATVEECP